MANLTFLASGNKQDMTLSDLSNSPFGPNIDIRMNSPNFNQAIKTEVPPLKLQSTPYLKSALPNRFYGPARVPRKGTSQSSNRPNLNDSKEAGENKSNTSFKKPFQALGQKINMPPGASEGASTEVQVREIRKKNRNYQPLSARDKSSNSIERVQTEGAQPYDYKSQPFEKIGNRQEKWESNSISDYNTNENIVRSYSAPSKDYLEITTHEKMMREIDELEPIKTVLEKTFASIQTKNAESCRKYLTGVINEKISEDCLDCNPIRLLDNYESINSNRSKSELRSSKNLNTFEDESFGSPSHQKTEVKPTFEGNKLKFQNVTKVEQKLTKPPLIQRGQNQLNLNLGKIKSDNHDNYNSVGSNVSNKMLRRGSAQDGYMMEDSTINYKTGGGSNFFLRLTKTSQDSYVIKFTSIYNSFETVIRENESTEVSFPRSFLSDGASNSPLLPFRKNSNNEGDLKVVRVQSARVHLASDYMEQSNHLKHSKEDRFLTQGNSPGMEDEDFLDQTCIQCQNKLDGVKRAIDEFVKIDTKVNPLLKNLNENVNKILKDLNSADKPTLIQNLTNLSQINKGFIDSAFLLSPTHAKGFETLWKCAILSMEYIFKIYDKRVTELTSSKNLLTGRGSYNSSNATAAYSIQQAKIEENRMLNEYFSETLGRRLSNGQAPLFLKKDNMATGNFGGLKKK